MSQQQKSAQRTLREEARRAKLRMKSGFWADCQADMDKHLQKARERGVNESKACRYFAEQVSAKIAGNEEDAFYQKVKAMLLADGETGDAIGKLTDKAYYQTLSYEEKQRYTLSLSEKYLRALERFRKECEFEGYLYNA